jgi:DNA primase catalytic subunit
MNRRMVSNFKTHYKLPRGIRYATLEERQQFYEDEFNIEAVQNWFGDRLNTTFAFIIARHTGIYLKEYAKIRNQVIILDEYQALTELKEYLLQYLPEGAYYDRNLYQKPGSKEKIGQELAFDLDPENVNCPYHGDIEKKMRKNQGLSFCMYEYKTVRRQVLRLYEELKENYTDLRIVYSGRGFHIHIMDKQTNLLTPKERQKIAKDIGAKYPIDEWVTQGEMRLIRLPHSLHGMVSRICIQLKPAEVSTFDFRTDPRCMPRFLRTISSS